MAVVTGIGGVFFKAKDPETLGAWYRDHLGMPFEAKMGMAVIRWETDQRVDGGATAWRPAKESSEMFSPGQPNFTINYRVSDLEALVNRLKASGVPIHKGPDTHDYGVFATVIDPEGNKVELWEPRA